MGLMVSYVRCQVSCWFRKTFKDESGAAEVVATLVIIGIALTLALVFRNQLKNLVANLWNNLVKGENVDGEQADLATGWGES